MTTLTAHLLVDVRDWYEDMELHEAAHRIVARPDERLPANRVKALCFWDAERRFDTELRSIRGSRMVRIPSPY